ncbi:hypothetical protein D9611_012280 [Ephemerocybe angulata]|uniref:C2H2-type domain-containing protein n=1 Tax=Ephemerocybe angulata TaxID=980116 RepID=A0A8H5AT61_9AGAR|nr:hypothetical protein D9611_012280 [Tulosesus angulatus]
MRVSIITSLALALANFVYAHSDDTLHAREYIDELSVRDIGDALASISTRDLISDLSERLERRQSLMKCPFCPRQFVVPNYYNAHLTGDHQSGGPSDTCHFPPSFRLESHAPFLPPNHNLLPPFFYPPPPSPMSSKTGAHGELDFICTRWDVILTSVARVVLVAVDSEREDLDNRFVDTQPQPSLLIFSVPPLFYPPSSSFMSRSHELCSSLQATSSSMSKSNCPVTAPLGNSSSCTLTTSCLNLRLGHSRRRAVEFVVLHGGLHARELCGSWKTATMVARGSIVLAAKDGHHHDAQHPTAYISTTNSVSGSTSWARVELVGSAAGRGATMPMVGRVRHKVCWPHHRRQALPTSCTHASIHTAVVMLACRGCSRRRWSAATRWQGWGFDSQSHRKPEDIAHGDKSAQNVERSVWDSVHGGG